MIVDGKTIAREILAELRREVDTLGTTPVVRAITVSPDSATESYLRIKKRQAEMAGMTLEVVELQADAGTDEVIHAVISEGADAVLVQLPLPESINVTEVLNAIPLEKDADVLTDVARQAFEENKDGALLPPVVGAVKEILERSNVSLKDKWVAVIGQGRLVGKPVAQWFKHQSVEKVTVFTEDSQVYWNYDILVSGVGKPHFITPDKLEKPEIIIDAGTSESGGAIAGDFDPSCAEEAHLFTPVPGGVGPIAVAYLFKNVLDLVRNK